LIAKAASTASGGKISTIVRSLRTACKGDYRTIDDGEATEQDRDAPSLPVTHGDRYDRGESERDQHPLVRRQIVCIKQGGVAVHTGVSGGVVLPLELQPL
jgi:hypothetical protein